MIAVDTQLIAFASGTVVPLLVALLVKARASSAVKAIANAVLSATAGALATLSEAGGFLSADLGVSIFYAWVASIATYQGLLKPTGIAGAIAVTVPGGLGRVAAVSPLVPPTPPPANTVGDRATR